MFYKDYSIDKFISAVGSSAPSPGGGVCAGLVASQGASLAIMVIDLTIGKDKYKQYEMFLKQAREKLVEYQKKCLDSMDWDKKCFLQMSEAYNMPKESIEEIENRRSAIQNASKTCMEPPFNLMHICKEIAKIVKQLSNKTNKLAISDIAVSALNIKDALLSSYMNVLINLHYCDDEDFSQKIHFDSQKILLEVLPICDKIYEDVLEMVK